MISQEVLKAAQDSFVAVVDDIFSDDVSEDLARAALESALPVYRGEVNERLNAVRELHSEDIFRGHLSNGCRTCGGGVGYPCPTLIALDAAL